MPSEAQLGHSRAVLLVGEAPAPLRAILESAQGWHLETADDVYAAAARLLKAAAGPIASVTKSPAAVLVLIESLRGDEFGFLDLLWRHWQGLPAAAIYDESAQDRRLDICRRKGVATVPSSGVVDWLSRQGWSAGPARRAEPDVATEPAPAAPGPVKPPAAPAAAAPKPLAPPPASQPQARADDIVQHAPACPDEPVHDASPAAHEPGDPDMRVDSAATAIHHLPEESFVDLPDELIAQFPDHLEDELPEHAPDREELSEADLERELPFVEEDEGEPSPGFGDVDDGRIEQLPLTPWSDASSKQARRPVRRPPGAGRRPVPLDEGQPEAEAQKHTGDSEQADAAGYAGRSAMSDETRPDRGLLTPEELRALLQDPQDGDDPQEEQP